MLIEYRTPDSGEKRGRFHLWRAHRSWNGLLQRWEPCLATVCWCVMVLLMQKWRRSPAPSLLSQHIVVRPRGINALPLEAKFNFLTSAHRPGLALGPRSPLANPTTAEGRERGIKNISFTLVSWCQTLGRSLLLPGHPAQRYPRVAGVHKHNEEQDFPTPACSKGHVLHVLDSIMNSKESQGKQSGVKDVLLPFEGTQ